MSNVAQIAQAEISQIQNEGIQPTLEEIVWLNQLGQKVESPGSETDPVLAGSPVKCGNVYLWPFTIQGGEWYDKHATRLFKREKMQRRALGFALAHGRDATLPPAYTSPSLRARGAFFSTLVDYESAKYAVNAWAAQAGCNARELEAAIVRLIPQMQYPHQIKRPPAGDVMSDAQLIAEVTAGTGLPMEYWLAHSSDYVIMTLTAIYAQQGAGGGETDDGEGYRRAMWDFMAASKAIREAHSNG